MDDPGPLRQMGTALLVLGLLVAGLGLALLLSDRLPWLGRLPGDLVFRRGRFSIFLPITTMVLLSLVLTLLLNLFRR